MMSYIIRVPGISEASEVLEKKKDKAKTTCSL